MQSARFLADFSASAAYPPDPLRRDQQKPASDQKVTYQKPCHKKGSNGCQRCGSSSSFPLGSLCCSPCAGAVVSEGARSQACHVGAGFDLDGFVTVWDEG